LIDMTKKPPYAEIAELAAGVELLTKEVRFVIDNYFIRLQQHNAKYACSTQQFMVSAFAPNGSTSAYFEDLLNTHWVYKARHEFISDAEVKSLHTGLMVHPYEEIEVNIDCARLYKYLKALMREGMTKLHLGNLEDTVALLCLFKEVDLRMDVGTEESQALDEAFSALVRITLKLHAVFETASSSIANNHVAKETTCLPTLADYLW
jgi:hypothetical protein